MTIANSTITNMRWFKDDKGVQVLKQERYFPATGTKIWEDVGTEANNEIPWTERFAGDEHKPHSVIPHGTDNIVKAVSKITADAAAELFHEPEAKAIEARLYAMLIRVCGGDIDHVREKGVYFNGNTMGMDLVRFMMVAYGGAWAALIDKLHLGKRN